MEICLLCMQTNRRDSFVKEGYFLSSVNNALLICRPSDSTVPKNAAAMEPRTVACDSGIGSQTL